MKKNRIILLTFFLLAVTAVLLYSNRHYIKRTFLLDTYSIKQRKVIQQNDILYDTNLTGDSVCVINSNSIIESIDGYAQGGVVFGNYAFFTGQYNETAVQGRMQIPKHKQYPFVSMIDITNFKIVKTFDFNDTYDSSPLVITRGAGDTIVVAHEHLKSRTSAFNINTGKKVWTSDDNQPGPYFFGYSYYERNDKTKIILVSSKNGLHAISSENGEELWALNVPSTGGVTPAVDQERGAVYYQCDNSVYKINVLSGEVEKSFEIKKPYSRCVSWNTILAEANGRKFITTYWYNFDDGKGAIRTFDAELNPLWEKVELTTSKKATLTYHNSGKIIIGCGNGWKPFKGDGWKKINAYNVATGEIDWTCDLTEFEFGSIINIPTLNNYLYAESQDNMSIGSSKIFRINALSGLLEEVFYYGKPVTSFATSIIAKGYIFSGNLWRDELNIVKIAEDVQTDWLGPFGDPQKNSMAINADSPVFTPMTVVGKTIKTYSRLYK